MRTDNGRFQRGVYPAEDFSAVKKYGLTMLVSSDDQVKAYIKKIMSQLDKWMVGGKISKLVVVITSKDTGEPVERWQFDVCLPPFPPPSSPFSLIMCLTGPNILQALQKEIIFQVYRQRKLHALRRNAHSRENRNRDPSRDPIYIPTNHCFRHLFTTTRWRLHVQCFGVCGCG